MKTYGGTEVKSRHSFSQKFMNVNSKASNSSRFTVEERTP
jgi:hypothetical protein